MCAGSLAILVQGDLALEQAIVAKQAEILDAMSKTLELANIPTTYANDTYNTLYSAKSTTIEGLSCLGSIETSGIVGNVRTNVDESINAGLAINGQLPTAN